MIRPMIYVYEKDIISIANKLELPVVPNNCPADGITKRTTMKEEMARFEAMNSTVRERMLNAVTTTLWAPLMLPEEEQVMKPIKKMMMQEEKESAACQTEEPLGKPLTEE